MLIIAPGYTMEAKAANAQIPSDYKMVAESDVYKLYLYESTLSIILENKETGALLRSTLSEEDNDGVNNDTWTAYMQSGIVATAIKGINDTYQVDLVSSANDISYSFTENGFSSTIFFKEYDFGFTVNVALEGSELVVGIPEESIIESGKDTFIGTISVFPMLGYTYLDDQDGYMLIPDGNGALIYLNDKDGRYSTGFSQAIYGSDIGFSESSVDVLLWGEYNTILYPEQVLAPVFGIIHSDDQQGYLAIVEEGDKRASIEAHPNGVMVNYNRCFAKFTLRKIYIQPLNNSNSGTMTRVEEDRTHSDLKVRYLLVSGEKANYASMAVAYRNYLLENDKISVKDTSYNTRVDFLGTDREEFLVFTKAVTMTTTDQISAMYAELRENGVDSLLTVYKGWQKGGLYNIPIAKYKADGSIGGTRGVTKLIKDSKEFDYQVYLYNNALRANPEENNTTFNTVKRINKRKLRINTWGYVYRYFNYLLPSKSSSYLDSLVEDYSKQGVDNLAIAGMSDNLFSYSSNGKFYSRYDCADSYESTLQRISENANLILEKPFAYLWNTTGAFLDMPLDSSEYMYEDEEVPFFSIVLKGIIPMYSDYVNFEANKQEFRLQMIESGVYPSFYLTHEDAADLIYTNSSALYSTKYETYKDTVIEYDKEFREVAEVTKDAFIMNHEKMANGVNKVTYDNGVVIYVNYNQDSVDVDGYQIEAMSYKVGESK